MNGTEGMRGKPLGKDAAAAAELLERYAPLLAATTGLNGEPQVRPIRFLTEREGALYFLTAKNRRLYAELCKDPRVEICVVDREGETCLRLSGRASFTEDEALLDDCGDEEERKARIAFFLLGARAELTALYDETPLSEVRLPDPEGVLIGITIRKKTELRDRISRILERREAELPAAVDETARLYDGALLLFAETAKALWPRMDVQPIERAAVFETWDERERYTKLAAELIGNAVIDKPEDLTYWLNRQTLTELRQRAGR